MTKESKNEKPEPKPEPKVKAKGPLEQLFESAGMDVGQAKSDLKAITVPKKDLKPNDVSRWYDKHFGGNFGRKLADAWVKELS